MPDAAPEDQDPVHGSAVERPPAASSVERRDRPDHEPEVVEAEIIERAAERAAEVVIRKMIVELRETNPAAPPAEDLVLLSEHKEVYADYMALWNQDLDRRWQYTLAEQAHEQQLENKQQAEQARLDLLEMEAVSKILTRSPIFALAFGLAGLLVALLVAVMASPVAGAVIAALDITTGIGLFLYSKSQGDTAEDASGGSEPA